MQVKAKTGQKEFHVHQVKTRFSNTYVIEDKGVLFVVDVASRCDGFVLRHVEKNMGYSVKDIQLVTCTHDDPDHIGGVIPLAKACHATSAIPHASMRPSLKLVRNPLGPVFRIATAMGEALRPRAMDMYMNRERKARYKHVHNHHLEQEEVHRYVPPKQRLTDGDRLPGFPDWEVIHTPGHSWDSICFYHECSGSLITGDTLLGSGTKGELVHPAIYDSPRQRRKTIHRLKALNPQVVYPGHGSVFNGNALLSHL